MGAMVAARAQTRKPAHVEALLTKFNERGLRALRALGLGENYDDHTFVVFSVSKINVPGKGPKIVVGIIDCNDQANDPETMAFRDAAEKMGKSRLSELTHGEANKNGAHLRRIRFIGDALIQRIQDSAMRHAEHVYEGKMALPRIAFAERKIPTLTLDETEKLTKVLIEIYDTPEVEKFEHISRFERNASASRRVGATMSQQLYKAAKRKD